MGAPAASGGRRRAAIPGRHPLDRLLTAVLCGNLLLAEDEDPVFPWCHAQKTGARKKETPYMRRRSTAAVSAVKTDAGAGHAFGGAGGRLCASRRGGCTRLAGCAGRRRGFRLGSGGGTRRRKAL